MSKLNMNLLRLISVLMFLGLIAGLMGLTNTRWVQIIGMVPAILVILLFIVKRNYYFWTIISDIVLLGMTIGLYILLKLTGDFQLSFILMGPLVLYAIMLYVQQTSGYPIFKDLDK